MLETSLHKSPSILRLFGYGAQAKAHVPSFVWLPVNFLIHVRANFLNRYASRSPFNLLYAGGSARCTNLTSPRSAHGAVGLLRSRILDKPLILRTAVTTTYPAFPCAIGVITANGLPTIGLWAPPHFSVANRYGPCGGCRQHSLILRHRGWLFMTLVPC